LLKQFYQVKTVSDDNRWQMLVKFMISVEILEKNRYKSTQGVNYGQKS